MAFEMKLTGMCQGCPAADPKINKLYSGDRPVEIFVTCANRELCMRIERHLMKYMDEHPYTGPDPLELDI